MSAFLPPAASAHAAEIDLVLTLVHVLMTVLFAGWGLYFVWALIRFRRGRQPRANPPGAAGGWALGVEAGVVAAEAVLLVVFALPVWYSRIRPERAEADSLVIRVVAEQFAWNVHYAGGDGRFGRATTALVTSDNPLGLDRHSDGGADDIVVQNQLHVPVNRPVIVELSSKDVVHSFGVPAMRVKQDAIPGARASVSFTPIAPGVYDIACSQLCGLAHFRMRGRLTVESEAAYRRFLAEERAALP